MLPKLGPAEAARKLSIMEDTRHDARPESVGEPAYKYRLTLKDGLIFIALTLCSSNALVIVGVTKVAFYLGQKIQLVLLGFLLALLAFCTQKQVLGLLVLCEARHGHSILQNFDAILRFDTLASGITYSVRSALLVLFALPLVVSAAYKLFVGGVVTKDIGSRDGLFGISGPPGTQRLGNGLSLMVNATLPFVVEPSISKTYGFNMYVVSNDTTAMLDGPLPSVSELRSNLSETQSIEMSALVNATVCSRNDPSVEQRTDASFGNSANSVPLYPGTFSLLTDPNNHSAIYVSTYGRDNNANETFGSRALGFSIERRRCNGTWRVTISSVVLLAASCREEPYGPQHIITNNFVALDQNTPQLAEFITTPYNYSQQNPTHINFAITVVGAMMWSRVTSLNGPELLNAPRMPPSAPQLTADQALYYYSPLIYPTISAIALRQSWALYLVILVHPILTLVAMVWKTCLFRTPVGEGFGLIAMLAGLSSRSFGILRGATFSGKLKRPIKVRIDVQEPRGATHSGKEGQIQYSLDRDGRSGTVQGRYLYH